MAGNASCAGSEGDQAPAVIEGRLGHGRHRREALDTGRDTPFTLVTAPNAYELPDFYELHLWLWKTNPNGLFADWNPRVSCRGLGF